MTTIKTNIKATKGPVGVPLSFSSGQDILSLSILSLYLYHIIYHHFIGSVILLKIWGLMTGIVGHKEVAQEKENHQTYSLLSSLLLQSNQQFPPHILLRSVFSSNALGVKLPCTFSTFLGDPVHFIREIQMHLIYPSYINNSLKLFNL